jgi:tetratricopeptide (TPR) repeat protein
MSGNHRQPFYLLFQDIWEYLDFRRKKREISCTSPDGLMKATLKQHGSWFSYTMTVGEDASISSTLQIFRATASRLSAFHLGCARMALQMKRHLRTGDPKWLKIERPFGALHGGIILADGNVTWRGVKDDIDPDAWLDLVPDQEVARILDRSDRLTKNYSGEVDHLVQLFRSWELLKTIPEHHEFNVEVMRRRVEFVSFDQEFEDLPSAVRWARALAEAEPYDVKNWWWLADIVEKLEGKAAAVVIVQEALRRHGPDFTLYYELASLLCALDRLDEAKEAMLLAIKEDIFSLKTALESECYAPIHDFIAEQQESDWYQKEKAALEQRHPSEEFRL